MTEPPPESYWPDPWVHGRLEEDAQRQATFDGDPPPGSHTRRHCVEAGVTLFAVLILCVFTAAETFLSDSRSHRDDFDAFNLFAALWTVVPPMTLLGGVAGYRLYGTVRKGQLPMEFRWYFWLLAFCVLGYLVVLLYFQRRRNHLILSGKAEPGWKMPVFYGCLLGFVFWLAYTDHAKVLGYVAGVVFTLLFGECVLVNIVAGWRNQRRLLPPPSLRFQFSLRGMLASVFALGLYVSGLIMLFGSPNR